MLNVEVNENWGQEIFINDLALYIRQFIKHALEEAIKQELTKFLGYEQYREEMAKGITTATDLTNGISSQGLA